jgi:hypothetical protein
MDAQEVQADYYNEHHGIVCDILTGDLVFYEVPTMLQKCQRSYYQNAQALGRLSRFPPRVHTLNTHVTSGVKKSAWVRHLRKVRLTSAQLEQLEDTEFYHDAEVLGQLPGRFVIIQTNLTDLTLVNW